MKPINIDYEGYLLTTDRNKMQTEAIHKWLSEKSYWSANIPYDVVSTAIENSFCFGAFYNGVQVGFGRMATDYSVFAYMMDVYVLEEHRRKGIATNMLQMVMKQEWVKKLKRLMLATLDAHELYRSVGFTDVQFPERYMVINLVDAYNAHNTHREEKTASK